MIKLLIAVTVFSSNLFVYANATVLDEAAVYELVEEAYAQQQCADSEITDFDFSGTFGGTYKREDYDGAYIFPSEANSWGGFANVNTELYPLTLPYNTKITFTAEIPFPYYYTDVYFRFEYNPHPDVEPSFTTSRVTIGNQYDGDGQYTINIPSQGSNEFSSVLLYISERDSGVIISDITIQACSYPDIEIPDTYLTIAEGAFSGRAPIFSVTIPDSMTSISDGAFRDSSIESVVIPSSVASIGDSAFEGSSIKAVILPDAVTSIGDSAFKNSSIESIELSDSLVSIGANAFSSTPLSSVVIPASVQTIGNSAFSGSKDNYSARASSISNLVFEENSSLTTIGEYAFYDSYISSLNIPASVSNIGSYAFAAYSGNRYGQMTSYIEELNFEENSALSEIAPYAFAGNYIQSVVIPDSVTSIGDHAFESNDMKSVVISDSVISIGEFAFADNFLTSLTLGNSVEVISYKAFAYHDLSSLTIPASVKNIGTGAFVQASLASNGCYHEGYNATVGICQADYDGLSELNFPEDAVLESIGAYAFMYALGDDISSIIIPDSVISIASNAFAGEGSAPELLQFPRQIITVNESTAFITDSAVDILIDYDVSDGNASLVGLGLRIHYDSSALTFTKFNNVLELDNITSHGPFNDDNNWDDNLTTDKYLLVSWASILGNWPGNLPISLLSVSFDFNQNYEFDTTSVEFSASSVASGYSLKSNPYTLNTSPRTWDFDANGYADALTDGIILIRYAFGLRGDILFSGAVSGDSSISNEKILNKLNSSHDYMDIDEDGSIGALSDGLMLLRYLFGFTGNDVTDNVVGVNAVRSQNEIFEHLQRHMPAVD